MESFIDTEDQRMHLDEEWREPMDLDTDEHLTPSTMKRVNYDALNLKETIFYSSNFFKDAKKIHALNDQWMRVDEEWGGPVDFETDEELTPSMIKHVNFHTLNLKKAIFSSSNIFEDAEKMLPMNNQWRCLKEEWGEPMDLDTDEDITPSTRKRYVAGEVLSAGIVENICEETEEIFKTADILSFNTSTISKMKTNTKPTTKQNAVAEIVECSILVSFDDTIISDEDE
ncbi:uncharacterized protein LOC116413390 [Galleria mellonella]|uniref:Uncharacterized protein LOC116413390 n=1 Tax=Galleria mellonella TaxID=7137 RepID=A0ABM3MI62_GALME|nr:uncharacterized protein LOC116413390 [Galleria mellonella]